MKQITIIILTLLTLIACETPEDAADKIVTSPYTCESLSIIGNWNESRGQLQVSENCTAIHNFCGYELSFTIPDIDTGQTTVTVHKWDSNRGSNNCMEPQVRICFMNIDESNRLIFDCGGFNQKYVIEFTRSI